MTTPARPETVADLRDAIADNEHQTDRLSNQRDKLRQRLADKLSPVRPGEKFTVTGRDDRRCITVKPGSVFGCDKVLPYRESFTDARRAHSYQLVARRILASGELSKLVYYFTREHKPRAVKGGAK